MKASHRLAGNSPSRGFGKPWLTPGFPTGAPILSGSEIRLQLGVVPGERQASPDGRLTETYRVYEIQPLKYGQVAVFRSASGAIYRSRASSYTDTVLPCGDEVRPYLSQGPGLEHLLRFDAFWSMEAFWNMPPDQTTMEMTPWVEEPEASLDFDLPSAFGPEKHRALLACYWKAASYQCFESFDEKSKNPYLFDNDPILKKKLPVSRTLVAVISKDTQCETIIRNAKAFLWSCIVSELPKEVQNIASMSAAVTLQSVPGIYHDSALAVVYPEKNISGGVDLTTGQCPSVQTDEDALIKSVQAHKTSTLLKQAYDVYVSKTGCESTDACPFMADYNVALSFFRLENAALSIWDALCEWYTLDHCLRLSHGINEQLTNQILENITKLCVRRLSDDPKGAAEEIAKNAIDPQGEPDPHMPAFLWTMAVQANDEHTFDDLTALLSAYHALQNSVFFPSLLQAKMLENPQGEKRVSCLMSAVLTPFYTHHPLTAAQIALLESDDMAALCAAHKPCMDALRNYLTNESDKNEQNRLAMLPLTIRFLQPDKAFQNAVELLKRDYTDQMPDAAQCAALNEALRTVNDHTSAINALTGYFSDCFQRHKAEPSILISPAKQIGMDMTGAFSAMLDGAAKSNEALSEAQQAALIGSNPADGLFALCRDSAAAMSALQKYTESVLNQSLETGHDLSAWLERVIAGLPLRGSAADAQTSQWAAQTLIQYPAAYASRYFQAPSDAAFNRILHSARPQKSEAFSAEEANVLNAYDAVIKSGAPDQRKRAVEQAEQLLDAFSSTEKYPGVCQIDQERIKASLTENWRHGGCLTSFGPLVPAFRRAGLSPIKLLEAMKSEEVQCIEKEISALACADDYKKQFRLFKTQEEELNNALGPELSKGLPELYALCVQTLKAHFVRRFTTMFNSCATLESALQLRATAENPLNCLDEIEPTTQQAKSASQVLYEVHSFIQSLLNHPYTEELLNKVMEAARDICYVPDAGFVHLLYRYYLEDRATQIAEKPFAIRVAVSLICSISPKDKRFDWRVVLKAACPGYESMLKAPYAAESLELLSAISALFSITMRIKQINQELNRNGNPVLSLTNFLNTDEEFSAYSDRVRKNKRALRRYFPTADRPDDPMSGWLNR